MGVLVTACDWCVRRNACFALHVAGLSEEVKVVKGCVKPLIAEYHGHSGKLVHGHNGASKFVLCCRDVCSDALVL